MMEKNLMIENKCLVVDIPCIDGGIGERCKNGEATICSTFNTYLEKAFFGEELDDWTRELMKNPECAFSYLPLITSRVSKRGSKRNDR